MLKLMQTTKLLPEKKKGDPVRTRVVAVSLNEVSSRESKIGLTMRQPSLGAHSWIYVPSEEEKKKESKKEKKKKAKKKGKK